MKKFLLIAMLPALLFSESGPQGGNNILLLKRSPGEAVFCGLVLPAGAALYNYAAISLAGISKLWDMVKGLHDAKAYNERLYFEKDFLRETD